MKVLVPVLIAVVICLAIVAIFWLLTHTPDRLASHKALQAALAELRRHQKLVDDIHQLAIQNLDIDPTAQLVASRIREFHAAPSRKVIG